MLKCLLNPWTFKNLVSDYIFLTAPKYWIDPPSDSVGVVSLDNEWAADMGSEKTPSPVTALSLLLGLTIRTSTTSLRLFLFSSDRPFVSFCVNVWRFTGPLVFFLCLILVYLLRPNKNRLSWLVSLLNRLLVWSGNLERCHEAAVRFCPPLAVEPAAHLAEEEGGPQAVGRPRLEQQTARQAITVRYFSNWGLPVVVNALKYCLQKV